MTAVVGFEHGGKVYIGADSAGVGGWGLTIRDDEKVFRTGPFVMGFTTSFRMGQLLRYRLNVPEQTSRQSDHEYLCTSFIDAVRESFKDGGYLTTEKGVDSGGTFLLGYRGKLWCIDSDFQVGRANDGYAACGCGEDIALGAMYASTIADPRRRIIRALEAAAHFSAGVAGPFKVVSL